MTAVRAFELRSTRASPANSRRPRTQSKVRHLRSRSAHDATAHLYRRRDSLLMMGSAGPPWFVQPWIGCAI
jgi:hypothetical protein